MPVLIVRPDAVRHNLALLEALCHAAGARLMPVFKEAPLHPDLTRALLEGSHVSSLGVIAWAGHSLPRAAGLEFHHVYSPAPALMTAACCHDAVYAGSLFSLLDRWRFVRHAKYGYNDHATCHHLLKLYEIDAQLHHNGGTLGDCPHNP